MAKEHKKVKAKMLYISTDMTLAEIAKKFKVSERTVSEWSLRDNWANEKKIFCEKTAEKLQEELSIELQKIQVECIKKFIENAPAIADVMIAGALGNKKVGMVQHLNAKEALGIIGVSSVQKKETKKELTGKDGGAIEINNKTNIDLKALSDDELRLLEKLLPE